MFHFGLKCILSFSIFFNILFIVLSMHFEFTFVFCLFFTECVNITHGVAKYKNDCEIKKCKKK